MFFEAEDDPAAFFHTQRTAIPAVFCVFYEKRSFLCLKKQGHARIFVSIMNKLNIEKLRGIRTLEFPIPDKPGVFLLTGANGAGKSTLLSALSALCGPGNLDKFFTPDIHFSDSHAGDVFADSLLRFTSDKGAFSFRFRDGSWHCSAPEGESPDLRAAGFPPAVFAGGREKYIPAADETFSVRDIRRAPDPVAEAAYEVFDDPKFHHLYMVYSERAGRDLFLIHRFSGGQDYYFSENNFSAGERALLRLAAQLPELETGTLVMLDEAEMALHPKSQKHLLEYLTRQAQERSLTILVSTQSASLIRLMPPAGILFLENDEYEGLVCRTNVYPAAVLGEMAFAEEILPELMLLVEDQEAALLLEAIVEKLKVSLDRDFPYCRILPVGGYMQVVILLDNLSRVFPPYVKRRAVLDQDAEPFIRKAMEEPERPHFDVVSRNRKSIYFLPCAPEQGVIRLLERDAADHGRGLSRLFDARIRLTDIMNSYAYRSIGGTSRSDCKDKLSLIVRGIGRAVNESEFTIRKKLYRYYADNRYRDIRELKEDYCSLIFRR